MCKVLSCLPGWVDLDGDTTPGCEYPCTITNGGIEICDAKDNNCNGQTDEGFDKLHDVHHCGSCDNDCTNLVQHPESRNAEMTCNNGTCAFVRCLNDGATGYWNADLNAANGCEYYCSKTNSGTEICDGKDNDCDGPIDEGFDKQTDELNCGSCGNACAYFHATGVCSGGLCSMGTCETGWVNLDGLASTGCEYQCTVTNSGTEICDGLDNDCNGVVDDPFLSSKGGNCVAGQGLCAQSTAGVYICKPDHTGLCCGSSSTGTCIDPFTGSQPETCNGVDDDCNGQVDDNVATTQTDANNCGACGNRCDVTYSSFHAQWTCTGGACVATGCLNNGTTGYWDTNSDLTSAPTSGNGCEYFCTRTSPSTEVCDGKDNDCNGKTDLDDPALALPTTGPAGNFCNQTGECYKGVSTAPDDDPRAQLLWPGVATHPVCRALGGVTAWYCNYPTTVDLVAPNSISFWELRCDGLDNNCDGTADRDRWAALTNTCYEDGTYGTTLKNGECRGRGTIVCKDGLVHPPSEPPADGLRCNVTTAGADPQPETCDNQDNDCDGLVDELWDSACVGSCAACPGGVCAGVRDNVYRVQRSGAAATRYPGGLDFYVYKLEAARPDASTSSAGIVSSRACSKGTPATPATLAYPWASLNVASARAACQAAGMRLCTTSEWTAACEGQCDTWRTDGCWMMARATQSGGSMAAGTGSFVFTGTGFQVSDVGKMLSVGAAPATGTFYPIIRYVSATQLVCSGTVSAQAGLSYTVMGQKLYPYNADLSLAYAANTCNGNDYVVTPSPSGTGDDPVTSGFMNQCVADTVYDMSGNLKEWTDDYRGALADGRKIYTLRGGSYTDPAQGMTCTFRDAVAAEDFSFPTAGFRCCKPALPSGVAPTDGYALCPMTTACTCANAAQCTVAACTSAAAGSFCDTPLDSTGTRHCARYVNWANDAANCGGCGVTCSGGTPNCVNGGCRP